MGKSMKSKYMKRKRMVKRERAGLLVDTPRLHANKKKLDLLVEGNLISEPKKKNAFRYPDEPDAEFPIHEEVVPLDFRAEALPAMAFAVRHARRKFSPEEQARHKRDRMTIPAKEAERLGLLDNENVIIAEESKPSEIDESNLTENTLSGAIINGVRRKITKPILTKTRNQVAQRKHDPVKRKKMVVSGSKVNKAAKTRGNKK